LNKIREKIEFGDFQTPLDLARQIVSVLGVKGNYETIIEPTCGLGNFLYACLLNLVESSKIHGWEINPKYVQHANKQLKSISESNELFVEQKDFFEINWDNVKSSFKEPILFIGNPPWVTNSELGKILGKNLPQKTNFHALSGIEAITGKSNFDISEWMLIKLLDFISGSNSSLAFLVKTSVARKLFQYSFKNKLRLSSITIKEINAKRHFNVNVDACLFSAVGAQTQPKEYKCKVYKSITTKSAIRTMGIIKGKLISDVNSYEMLSQIDQGCEFKWRSGIKHDVSKIMEFDIREGMLVNGLGDIVDLSFEYLYPLYKSSDISRSKLEVPTKYVLITQRKIGEETKLIKLISPETWNYLLKHANTLDKRKSIIYRNAPRFSIFGVGDYTFKPWKIVISGLYKNVVFKKIGSYKGKPIVVDDTCYMLGFDEEEKADLIHELLSSEICKKFIASIMFTDNKRPITVSLLNRINFKQIAGNIGRENKYMKIFESENRQFAFL